MKVCVEKEYLLLSMANYPLCTILIGVDEAGVGKAFYLKLKRAKKDERFDITNARYSELSKKTKAVASEALHIPVEKVNLHSFTFTAEFHEFRYRSFDWENQAEQSLGDMGMSDEDRLNGKDLLFTDHCGIFIPKEGASK